MDARCFETRLKDTLLFLACALTGKGQGEIATSITESNLSNLLNGQEFYLPDGGYSRVVVGVATRSAFLTDNSRREVKEAWGRCKELIADLETLTFEVRRERGLDH